MNSFYSRSLLVLACILLPINIFGLDATEFDDPQELKRYQALTEELRCLVCQNETIAGSSAPLAVDLRQQVAKQINAGQSDEQIRAYMTERYGEFILYRPSDSGAGKILWVAPLFFLLFAAFVFVIVIENRKVLAGSDDELENDFNDEGIV